MKRLTAVTVIAAACIGLTGCDNAMFDSVIKKKVREGLKDPDSAKFEKELVNENFACISYNAKNSYGGYSGIAVAHLELLSADNWYVHSLDGAPCSDSLLSKKNEIRASIIKSQGEMFDKLKRMKLIPDTVKAGYEIKDVKCRDFVYSVSTNIALTLNEVGEPTREHWNKELQRQITLIDAGVCAE